MRHKTKQVFHFSSLRRLIVLHRKQNIEGELKWQTCYIVRCIEMQVVS